MEWLDQLNQSLEYLEEHLTEEISYEKVAQKACCSTYHYQRMFSYIADVSLGEYIRRRRMSLAAVDLQKGMKVVDVAVKYGYDSPTAFNRAFKKIQGLTPQQAKNPETKLMTYPKLSFSIQIKGVVAMEYQLIEKATIRCIGKKLTLGSDMELAMQEIPKFWNELAAKNELEKLIPLMNPKEPGVFGISIMEEENQNSWAYMIAVASEEKTDDFEVYQLPAAKWAIFEGRGAMPDAIQDLNKKVYSEWLPTSGFEYANLPSMEVYLNADPVDAHFQVWFPVK